VQTIWGTLRRTPDVLCNPETFALPDGDLLSLVWNDHSPRPHAPLVVLLHGLAGSTQSSNIRGISAALTARGVSVVAVNFRGCGPVPSHKARGYHAGETEDVEAVLASLGQRFPDSPLHAVGISLGGNVLLCHLGSRGASSPLHRAVAVCPPVDLQRCMESLSTGLARGYQWYLLRGLKQTALRKQSVLQSAGVDVSAVQNSRSFRDFDDAVTAPLFGFHDADDYYTRCSSRSFLRGIHVPTTVLFAADDPFMHPSMIPAPHELAPAVRFEVSARGGHVGFVSGWGRCWLDQRVADVVLESSTGALEEWR
jgi:predicted alpha/beta-fold hydrolase